MNYFFIYWEAYDQNGRTLLNGNGDLTVDGQAKPEDFKGYADFLVENLKENYPQVERIVFKSVTKI